MRMSDLRHQWQQHTSHGDQDELQTPALAWRPMQRSPVVMVMVVVAAAVQVAVATATGVFGFEAGVGG